MRDNCRCRFRQCEIILFMKMKCFVGITLLAMVMVSAQTNTLTPAFEQGLFAEEANHDLAAAISNYQALAEQFDRDRPVAATAIFRLGECYRKLGRTNDAIAQYQRIVREFGDQKDLAELSRRNLDQWAGSPSPHFQQRLVSVIQRNSQPAADLEPDAEALAKAADLEAHALSLKAYLDRLMDPNRESARIAAQQIESNPVLTSLIQQLNDAEQKRAGLTNDYALDNPHVTAVTAQIATINAQIDAQVDGLIN